MFELSSVNGGRKCIVDMKSSHVKNKFREPIDLDMNLPLQSSMFHLRLASAVRFVINFIKEKYNFSVISNERLDP